MRTPDLEARVAVLERKLAAIGEALGVRPAGYSDRKGCGPAGYADRKWKALAKRIGVRRGRWFYVSAEQLAAHEAKQAPAPVEVSPAPAAPWNPRKALEAAGLRVVGGSR